MSGAIEPFEQHADEYDAWFERNPAAYRTELRAIKAALPASGSGLEIGVGTGRCAAPLGVRAGIDPSPAMAAIARTRGIEVTIGKLLRSSETGCREPVEAATPSKSDRVGYLLHSLSMKRR